MAERSVTAFNTRVPLSVPAGVRRPQPRREGGNVRAARRRARPLHDGDRDRAGRHRDDPSPADVRSALPRHRRADRERAGRTCSIIASLPAVAAQIQRKCAGAAVEEFVDHLWRATHDPGAYGIALAGVDMDDLMLTGASPRGMSMLVRAAKVSAWLAGRSGSFARGSSRSVPRGHRTPRVLHADLRTAARPARPRVHARPSCGRCRRLDGDGGDGRQRDLRRIPRALEDVGPAARRIPRHCTPAAAITSARAFRCTSTPIRDGSICARRCAIRSAASGCANSSRIPR